jgi:hypothetical protein
MNSRLAKIALAVAIAVLASSCSYVTMQRPETLEADMPVCVSNRLAPTIDSVQAASHGLSTLFTIGNTAAAGAQGLLTDASTEIIAGAIIGGIGATAIWTASAVSGFNRARSCERLKRGYYDELQQGPEVRYYDTSANTVRESRARDPNPPEDDATEQESTEPEDGSQDEPTPEDGEYMSVIEAAMHCGSSRRDVWDKIDDGTFSTRRTQEGAMLLKEDVKEECGEEPEVPLD